MLFQSVALATSIYWRKTHDPLGLVKVQGEEEMQPATRKPKNEWQAFEWLLQLQDNKLCRISEFTAQCGVDFCDLRQSVYILYFFLRGRRRKKMPQNPKLFPWDQSRKLASSFWPFMLSSFPFLHFFFDFLDPCFTYKNVLCFFVQKEEKNLTVLCMEMSVCFAFEIYVFGYNARDSFSCVIFLQEELSTTNWNWQSIGDVFSKHNLQKNPASFFFNYNNVTVVYRSWEQMGTQHNDEKTFLVE